MGNGTDVGRPSWNESRQPDPPNFGQAKLRPRWWLQAVVAARRRRCERILREASRYCEYEPGLISLVVLSCKRKDELTRLYHSMDPFFRSVEADQSVEKILVDNGSGAELVDMAASWGFFDRIIANPENLGMATALDRAFPECRGEYILLLEDDFVLDYDQPFLGRCLGLFQEFPEIGTIRLKNQNNWWKPHRRIGPLRSASSGTDFWTWMPARHWRPSLDRTLNVWCSGSVLFRKVSFFSTGRIPDVPNVARGHKMHQGYVYECVYGQAYNRVWLAAKVKGCYPFVQPNDTPESQGWSED